MSVPDEAAARPSAGSDITPAWARNPALVSALAAGVFLAGLGLVLGRAELAVVALPILVTAAFGARVRLGGAAIRVATTLAPSASGRGVAYRTAASLPPSAEAVALEFRVVGGRRHVVVVGPGRAEDLAGTVPIAHSGPQEILRTHVSLLGRGGLAVTVPAPGPVHAAVIPPPHLRMQHLPMPRRVTGITGAHDSTRPGDGGEFRDVALFAPGDRLRRIDWRRTARRASQPGDLYVRRTFATADALVVLVVDGRDDLGSDVTEWGGARHAAHEATSLDLARESAVSLATAYISAGDRVGFRDLAGTARSVEPGGGTRHLERLRSTIASVTPGGEAVSTARMPLVPAASLVVVLSTFLDDQAAAMAMTWAATGHRVVAVDVLPTPDTSAADKWERAAFRLVTLERDDRLAEMAATGVELIRWQAGDGGSPAVQLRLLSRPRRAG
ncbi:DUF58 domain-containing protein [Curtobacterium sp. VKM Ac-2922]|uniref:DUF58 domain-containing protein n=1 Tax=Curtobacterium sp. VKM Ac-2922 TaxID=2929475 RepID=UPI001FB227C6|nr:DUF58 domain-containing protein [Curtobacterium sp. VKM Ac-2922]MCJ1712949.1 DUF58 domain-containing protein [Curtobacterium sp. VKM Ac-2922]